METVYVPREFIELFEKVTAGWSEEDIELERVRVREAFRAGRGEEALTCYRILARENDLA